MTTRRLSIGLIALTVMAFAACASDADEDDADEAETTEQPVSPESGGDDEDDAETDELSTTSAVVQTDARTLLADMTWQWQLQGEINTSYDADVYDIDLFDAPDAVISELHNDGRVVICYFSAGSYEEWRDDASQFAEEDLGESLDGWEGERWVDIRSDSVRSLMVSRLDLAAERGCDGVEPDNVTAHNNETGFDIVSDDQLSFNTFLADSANDRGLLVGLKNDLDQIPDLVDRFDFAVNEECLEYDECELYEPFVAAGKPVFSAEYSSVAVEDSSATCAVADAAGLRTLILPIDLDDSFRISCTN